MPITIQEEAPTKPDVLALLDAHLTFARATSPACSVHALEPETLAGPDIRFWTLREDGVLAACGALKTLRGHGAGGGDDGEVKSMHTAAAVRGRGLGLTMLEHIAAEGRRAGLTALYLETGSQPEFAVARRLYARFGFTEHPPFAAYKLDPNSVFMRLGLT